jgi:protein phosphatase PTC7
VKREQHFSEDYQKNKPLCFNSKSYQKTHPMKQVKGQKDADATLCSPMLIGIADGVSQIEEFGIDASELPNELLNAVEELAVSQLLPGQETEEYLGPISMMREAYESTDSLGSTTVLTAIMDNSTKIHGKLHPMVAVCSIGDCEILILRRSSKDSRLQTVFHTEMQRIDGNAQSPLQLARVDETVDPDFDASVAIEVIERGSAVHCVSAFEGDIVILGSDGVFDNLFIDEIVSICDSHMPPRSLDSKFKPVSRKVLGDTARQIVFSSHAKTEPRRGQYTETPIGRGGKIDDTSCVVSQVVEWTEEHGEAWAELRQKRWWRNVMTCGGNIPTCEDEIVVTDYEHDGGVANKVRNYPAKPNASFTTGVGSEYGGSFDIKPSAAPRGPAMPIVLGYEKQQVARYREARRPERYDEGDDKKCSIM